MRFLLITLLILSGCGSAQQEPAFRPHYDEFKRRYNTDPYGVSIEFGVPDDNQAGQCHIWARRITVKQSEWESMEHYGKELLVFHELGHCVWGLRHIEDEMEYRGERMPRSIMYPAAFGDLHYYKELRELYLKELPNNRGI